MITPQLYEITLPSGHIHTVRAMSPVNAVARYSMAPRHNWEKTPDGLLVTARKGDGTNLDTYNVKLSCFEPLPYFGDLL